MIPVTPAVISETAVHVDTMVYGTAVYVDTMAYSPDLVTRVNISETAVHGSDVTVKSSAVETAAVETAMPSASVPSARVGEVWLAKDNSAQQRSCNGHDGSHPSPGGFMILQLLHRQLLLN